MQWSIGQSPELLGPSKKSIARVRLPLITSKALDSSIPTTQHCKCPSRCSCSALCSCLTKSGQPWTSSSHAADQSMQARSRSNHRRRGTSVDRTLAALMVTIGTLAGLGTMLLYKLRAPQSLSLEQVGQICILGRMWCHKCN